MPEYTEIFKTNSSLTPESLITYSIPEKLVLILSAYKTHLYQTSFSTSLYQKYIMYIFETHIFKPIHDKVLVKAIQNIPKDTESVVKSMNTKGSQFKLVNKNKLELDLEAEGLRKYIKRIKRVKR